MIEASRCHRHAAVIGGGLLGLEAACGLAARGMQVTVVHLAPWLMERQLDATAAQLLQQSLEARGLDFRLASNTQALLAGPDARVAAVQLADGSSVAADLVVMAIGIRPNTLLAEAAGLECARGIVVDDTLQTSDAHIYAVGECASHRGCCYGLVAPLVEQAAVLAEQLAGRGTLRYTGSVLSTKLKVTGIEVFSAGDFQTDPGADELVLADPEAGIYRKLVLREGRLVGACLYGDTGESSWYLELLRGEHAIAELRDELMFGRPEATAGEPPHAPEVARAAA
jgi:nitrite reductase (NADH) large subunit